MRNHDLSDWEDNNGIYFAIVSGVENKQLQSCTWNHNNFAKKMSILEDHGWKRQSMPRTQPEGVYLDKQKNIEWVSYSPFTLSSTLDG